LGYLVENGLMAEEEGEPHPVPQPGATLLNKPRQPGTTSCCPTRITAMASTTRPIPRLCLIGRFQYSKASSIKID
jgi:hypothetical protein